MSGLREIEIEGDAGCWEPAEFGYSEFSRAAHQQAEASRAEARRRQERLTRTIEAEIIPRLMLAHAQLTWPAEEAIPAERRPGLAEIEDFARISVKHDLSVAMSYVGAMREEGVSTEAILLDLMVPAARLLGEWWMADLCDFVDVTVGLSKLQQMLRDIGPLLEQNTDGPGVGRRILLAGAPGERHTFGLAMVEEFFRRAGWDVSDEHPASLDDLLRVVRSDWFAVVGLSVAGDVLVDELAAIVRAIRRASLNRAVGVMVGGRAFAQRPELVVRIGADATASDARQAVVQAQNLLGLMSRRC